MNRARRLWRWLRTPLPKPPTRGGVLLWLAALIGARPVGVLLIEHPAADTAISVISGVLLLVILARFGWLYVRWRRHG